MKFLTPTSNQGALFRDEAMEALSFQPEQSPDIPSVIPSTHWRSKGTTEGRAQESWGGQCWSNWCNRCRCRLGGQNRPSHGAALWQRVTALGALEPKASPIPWILSLPAPGQVALPGAVFLSHPGIRVTLVSCSRCHPGQ